MATPKVFVSSTCYDLKEIRDNLYEFIDSLGYIPIFSDKNDVFYHPDLHTHESCLKEIESCQLFVLIIGGRFGGQYKYDTSKSIVNAEYSAAKELNMPIVTFVNRDVYSNHFMYERNKGKKFKGDIEYTAISDQRYAENIFEFINAIRKTDTNNALFEFEFARDIKSILKKQFAGMFYDFLWNRKNNLESEKTQTLLRNLTLIGEKTEEIIKNIYRKVEPEKSESVIMNLENETKAKKFWIAITQLFGFRLRKRNNTELREFVSINEHDDWTTYLIRNLSALKLVDLEVDGQGVVTSLLDEKNNIYIGLRSADTGKVFAENEAMLLKIEQGFDSFKAISEEARINVINEITWD